MLISEGLGDCSAEDDDSIRFGPGVRPACKN